VIKTWLVFSFALWATSRLVPGFEIKGGAKGVALVALLFGLLNWSLGWLVRSLIVVATLGLGLLLMFITRWVANTLILMLTDRLSESLRIQSASTAAIAALVMSVFWSLGEWLLRALL